jgi:hypothetical protein
VEKGEKHILFQYSSLKSHGFGDNSTKMNDRTVIVNALHIFHKLLFYK